MHYKGIRMFSEQVNLEGEPENIIEHETPILFDFNDVKRIERYCYKDRFVDVPEKIWVTFHGEDTAIVIKESFEVFEKLFLSSRLNKNIYVSESIKNHKFVEPNNNHEQKHNSERSDSVNQEAT